jgi:hypothetical protein
MHAGLPSPDEDLFAGLLQTSYRVTNETNADLAKLWPVPGFPRWEGWHHEIMPALRSVPACRRAENLACLQGDPMEVFAQFFGGRNPFGGGGGGGAFGYSSLTQTCTQHQARMAHGLWLKKVFY